MRESIAKPGGIRVDRSPASNRDLTRGSISIHMVRLTSFMMLGMVSFTVASLIETVYIGHVGTSALAAVGFTFPLVYTLQGFSMGLSVGASSVVARTIGMGDREKVKRLATHCVLLVTVVSLLVGCVSYFLLESIFSLLGASDVILPLAVAYMSIWLMGLPVFTMSFVGTTLMRASGDAITPGYLMAIGSFLHVTIAPFFIFGIGPCPEMGLEGAALSFVIARYISFIMIAYCFSVRDRMMQYDLTGFFGSCREILHVGLPSVATNLIMPISMSVVTRLLAGHGAVVVAGFGVASRIESMLIMLIFAVSISISPVVGQNWGAGQFDRIKKAMRISNIFVLVWGGISYLILIAFGEYIVSMINDDPEVVETACNYLLIGPLSVGFMGVMSIATHSFNSLGKPVPPLILSLLQMIAVGIPLALLGNYLWGYMGIFAGQVLTSICLSVVAWYWIRYTINVRIARSRIHKVTQRV